MVLLESPVIRAAYRPDRPGSGGGGGGPPPIFALFEIELTDWAGIPSRLGQTRIIGIDPHETWASRYEECVARAKMLENGPAFPSLSQAAQAVHKAYTGIATSKVGYLSRIEVIVRADPDVLRTINAALRAKEENDIDLHTAILEIENAPLQIVDPTSMEMENDLWISIGSLRPLLGVSAATARGLAARLGRQAAPGAEGSSAEGEASKKRRAQAPPPAIEGGAPAPKMWTIAEFMQLKAADVRAGGWELHSQVLKALLEDGKFLEMPKLRELARKIMPIDEEEVYEYEYNDGELMAAAVCEVIKAQTWSPLAKYQVLMALTLTHSTHWEYPELDVVFSNGNQSPLGLFLQALKEGWMGDHGEDAEVQVR